MKDQAICRRKPLVLIASSLPFPTPTRELMRSIPRGDNRIFYVQYLCFGNFLLARNQYILLE